MLDLRIRRVKLSRLGASSPSCRAAGPAPAGACACGGKNGGVGVPPADDTQLVAPLWLGAIGGFIKLRQAVLSRLVC